MAAKQILHSRREARHALERDVNTGEDAVGSTLGPKGRNVVLDRKYGSPTITNDSVITIAKEIELEKNPFSKYGAQLLRKEVATKTNDIAVTAPPPPLFWRRPWLGKG